MIKLTKNTNKISYVTNSSIDNITKLDSVIGDTPIMLKLKEVLRNNSTCTIIFVIIFLILLLSNGYWNTNFDLDSLLTLYGVIYAKQAIKFGIDSSLNSPREQSPQNFNSNRHTYL